MTAEEMKKYIEEKGLESKWIESPGGAVEVLPGGVKKETLLKMKALLEGEASKLRSQSDALRSEAHRIRHGGGR